jgi:hypothetical protein
MKKSNRIVREHHHHKIESRTDGQISDCPSSFETRLGSATTLYGTLALPFESRFKSDQTSLLKTACPMRPLHLSVQSCCLPTYPSRTRPGSRCQRPRYRTRERALPRLGHPTKIFPCPRLSGVILAVIFLDKRKTFRTRAIIFSSMLHAWFGCAAVRFITYPSQIISRTRRFQSMNPL